MRKPAQTGRKKVTTRPVKVRHTQTEMSCGGGVKVWYNKMTAKTAVFGLQLRERDGRNEKETNAGNIGDDKFIAR